MQCSKSWPPMPTSLRLGARWWSNAQIRQPTSQLLGARQPTRWYLGAPFPHDQRLAILRTLSIRECTFISVFGIMGFIFLGGLKLALFNCCSAHFFFLAIQIWIGGYIIYVFFLYVNYVKAFRKKQKNRQLEVWGRFWRCVIHLIGMFSSVVAFMTLFEGLLVSQASMKPLLLRSQRMCRWLKHLLVTIKIIIYWLSFGPFGCLFGHQHD